MGTAAVGNSTGTIVGKVTVERFIPARRAWRLFCSPVTASSAPTINAAWQEGATSSTANPHPGYGTHITYGISSDGFDQNPQKSFSMKIRNSSGTWIGVPATNRTLVTDYPAYMIFIRGNRSYDITSTTNITTPTTTNLRTTGNLKQGTQPNIAVDSAAFVLVGNPYASPIDFNNMYSHSPNIARRIRVWDPGLGGSYGAGAYVTVYWNGNSYSSIPTVTGGSALRYIQANEGFFVEGSAANASVSFLESDKDTSNNTTPFGRLTDDIHEDGAEIAQSKLEVNLKVFNSDSSTGIADGIGYLFSNLFNNDIDKDDITKLANTNENLSIASNGHLLTVEQRTMPVGTDSLHMNLTGVKTTKYQLEFIPDHINSSLYLFDKYLNTKTPVSATDTSRITITINTSDALSKAADRFTIVTKSLSLLPVTFTNIKAVTKENTIVVSWTMANEEGVNDYEVEKSADGSNFNKIGDVKTIGSKSYNFIDNYPFTGINYYRIKSVAGNGTPSYTNIASTMFDNEKGSNIAVFPNPVKGNRCTLLFHNQLQGEYSLTLINSSGQSLLTETIHLEDNNTMLPLVLPSPLANGVYQLQVESKDKKEMIKLLIAK